MKVQNIIDKLIQRARFLGSILSSMPTLQYYIKRNKEVPDHLLPGRMLQTLSDEERKTLKSLKAEMINDRQGIV